MGLDQSFYLKKWISSIDWIKTNGGDLVHNELYDNLVGEFLPKGIDDHAKHKSAHIEVKLIELRKLYPLEEWLDNNCEFAEGRDEFEISLDELENLAKACREVVQASERGLEEEYFTNRFFNYFGSVKDYTTRDIEYFVEQLDKLADCIDDTLKLTKRDGFHYEIRYSRSY